MVPEEPGQGPSSHSRYKILTIKYRQSFAFRFAFLLDADLKNLYPIPPKRPKSSPQSSPASAGVIQTVGQRLPCRVLGIYYKSH